MRAAILALVFFSVSVFAQNPSVNFLFPDTIHQGDTLDVKVVIKKTGIYGFAKLEIYIPAGFDPLINDVAGASVVFRNEVLKYFWIEIPAKSEINFELKFVTDVRLVGVQELYGRFHYISGGKRQSEKFPVKTAYIDNSEKPVLPDQLALYGKKFAMPVPAVGLSDTSYRVQIGAFRKRVPKEILLEFYPDETKIFEEQTEGYYKYSIGNFPSFPQAAEFRNICGIRGAFTVKYVKDKRQ